MSAKRTESDIDNEYLNKLERRLNSTKVNKPKDIIKELAVIRDYQISQLVDGTSKVEGFEVTTVQAGWLQRKVNPESVAISKEELLKLVENDSISQKQEATSTSDE